MGYDIISALPDSLITQILLCLPTKASVKTSVLSKRWRNLYLDVPGLDLHSNDFLYSKDAIKNFTDKFLESNRGSRLEKFKIKYDECNIYLYGISEWIASAINRGARYLNVGTLRCPFTKDFMPLDIYKSQTLTSLKLVNVGMLHPEIDISLPRLKILHLENNLYSDKDPLIIEKLMLGCPVLEDLTVFRVLGDNLPILRVQSRSLKRFCVTFIRERGLSGVEFAVEIDAPGLEYMKFRDDHSDRVVAKNLTSLVMIDIDTIFNVSLSSNFGMKKVIVRDFLTGVSSVRRMIISRPAMQVLYRYLKPRPVYVFDNVTRLEASLCTLLLKELPDFLGSFPNLKHLILYLVYLYGLVPEDLELTVVPRCLLSSLECVEIKEVVSEEKIGMKRARNAKRITTHTKKAWMQTVKYILENSLVLKKLVLCFEDSNISKELRTFKKSSQRCEIFINLTFP